MLKIAVCFSMLLALPAQAGEGSVHWAYTGEHGPEHWGDLSPKFVQCKVGLNQSPINIVDALDAELPTLELDYSTSTVDLVNNGHTAQANVQPGNYLRVGGEAFELIQFHMHTPSEHRIKGKSFLMETHYVHRNEKGELAVLALLHHEGPGSEALDKLEREIPEELNKPVAYRESLSGIPIIRVDKAYYRYNGSLTTPPCSEGVRWFVLKQSSAVSLAQQALYQKLIGDDARGPQSINARLVLE
jgi:carbonic anhydrase